MVSFDSIFQWGTAPADICLELALCFMAYKRRLGRQLTFFSVYIVVVTVQDIAGWWASYTPWFNSMSANYVFWSIQFALSLLRLLTIGEIVRQTLRGYPAIWGFAWRSLSAVTVFLFSWTIYSAIQRVHHFRRFLAVGGQRFELMQTILLLLFLFLVVYYRVQISRLYRLILIGICIYSAVQVAANQLLLLNKLPADSIFDYIRRGVFLVPLVMWTYAVWPWGSDSDAPPDLIPQATYDALSPQIHDRLRELNDKLIDLTGKRRP
jgi:hypothetical protein